MGENEYDDQSPRPRKRQRRSSSPSDHYNRSGQDRHQRRDDSLDADSRRRRSYGDSRNREHNKSKHERYRSQSPANEDHEDTERQRRRGSSEGYKMRYRSKHDRGTSRSRSRERRRRNRHGDDYEDRSEDRKYRSRHRDRSPARSSRSPGARHEHQKQVQPYERSKRPLPSQKDAFSTTDSSTALDKPLDKQKPNFGLTGKLAAASNTVQTAGQTIVLKYHEPPEARKPAARDQWRLYVFKGDEIVETVELSEQSCWLFGREVAVADFPIEHPSCSKQHAVIQFRYVDKKNEFGDRIGKVKPYVIDLESANGTSVNDETIPAAQYVELRDKDVVKFGHSSREYMIQLPPRG